MAELIGKLSARSAVMRPDDIQIDGNPTSSLGFEHISQEDYHQKVADNEILSNMVYVVSSDYLNMYDEQIKNLAPGTDQKDAVNVSQLSSAAKELSNAMVSRYNDLSITMSCADAFLSNAISTKIYVGGVSALSSVESLSICQVSQDYYHDLVLNGKVNSKTVYIVSSDALNMYDEKIINMKDGEAKQDAATVGQVSLSVTDAKTELSSALSSTKNELQETDKNLSSAIDAKIWVDDRNGSLSSVESLSIKYISQSAYHDLVLNDAAVSNCLYVVSADGLNMYGEQIKNLKDGKDPSDATTLSQLDSKTKSIFDVKDALLSYINEPSISPFFENNKLKTSAPTSCLVDLVNIIVENIVK